MTMWMPVVLWGLHRTLASGRMRDGLATGAAFGAQWLSALYYGTFLIPFTFVVGTCLWLARGRPLRPLRALAAGAVVAGVMFAPVFAVFLQTRPEMGDRPIPVVGFYSAEGPDYLKADYRSGTVRMAVGGCQAGAFVVSSDCAGCAGRRRALAAALGHAHCVRAGARVFASRSRLASTGPCSGSCTRTCRRSPTSGCPPATACSQDCHWACWRHLARPAC